MTLMITFVIPKLSAIIEETGQAVPLYTKIVIATSYFMRDYILLIFLMLIAGGVILWRYFRTAAGVNAISKLQLSIPYIGSLYKKLYLARITDNLQTMLSSGIPVIKALETTSDVVGNRIYEQILKESTTAVKQGVSISEALSKYEEIPPLVSQMLKIGEESGKLNFILKTMAKFYKREVDSAVENLVTLIEPLMIIVLAVGVGLLLVSILGPIYNITAGF
jgi:type IV pilus assembly protein PilC